MKIDVMQPIMLLSRDADTGERVKLQDEKKKPVLVRDVLIGALLGAGPRCSRCGVGQFPSDTQDGTEKLRRWKLAQRIDDAKKSVELSADHISMLKKLVVKAHGTLVVGQVLELLDPVGSKEAVARMDEPAEEKPKGGK